MATKEIGVVEDEVSDKYIGLVNWSIIEAKGVVLFFNPILDTAGEFYIAIRSSSSRSQRSKY